MKGIREKQRLLVQLLTTKAFNEGTMRPSTKKLLEETIAFCAKYENAKRPFVQSEEQEKAKMCDCDDAQETHQHCIKCDCVLTSHESETLCRSCE